MSSKIEQNLTKEAIYKDISKWQAFLEGYKDFYGFDFEWSRYIKDCKLYYGHFDIHGFIKAYGKECEEDFKKFKALIAQKKQEEQNKEQAEQELSKELFNVYDQLFYADSLRVRLLINFLNPENSYEKKALKKSWKKAKSQGLTKREWMKSILNIPFKKGERDPHDYRYDYDEVHNILKQIKEIKKEYLNKNIKERSDRFSTKKMNEFEENINEASLVIDFHNDFATKLIEHEKKQASKKQEYLNYRQVVSGFVDEQEYQHENVQTQTDDELITKPFQKPHESIPEVKYNTLPKSIPDIDKELDLLHNKKVANYQDEMNDFFQKKLDQKIREIKSTSDLINSEFKKAEWIRKKSEIEYEKTKEFRQNLTKEIENINQSYSHKKR
ncbi:DUF5454 family protein [Mycoplasma bradburyae]|uniref:DUF5454 family protein n=1 Tax=Mycoplasma bradburyae TaxID=2963128 RepID=A0ABT5GAG3_9MOLU|nr:DUF5454 family protein [Mycoplasma bradburyae]MDC4181967.1 DUF5454 family protein [Mycoplasma bradburyae]MDC4182670.1 DUF5454 family protein [Mycoplasma bradburyae]UTS70392.1 DUF5454 family protein [Mycoplasma bradburyae]